MVYSVCADSHYHPARNVVARGPSQGSSQSRIRDSRDMILRNRMPLILALSCALAPAGEALAGEPVSVRAVVNQFCVSCHEGDGAKGGLDLTPFLADDVGRHPKVWERVARRLRGRQMPPAGKKRPDEDTYGSVLGIFLAGMLTKSRGNNFGNVLAMIIGFIVVAVLSGLPNNIAALFGTKLYQQPDWLPVMEFPWWICFGTIVTFSVAVLFRTGREHQAAPV